LGLRPIPTKGLPRFGCTRVCALPIPEERSDSMDEALRVADEWRQKLAGDVAAKRQRAREILSGEQERLRSLEGLLTERLDELARQISQQDSLTQSQAAEFQSREAILEERNRAIEARHQELAA